VFHGWIPPSVDRFTQWLIIGGMLNTMRLTRMLSEAPLTDDMHVHQRTKVVEHEAKKRGMRVNVLRFFTQPTNLFTLDYGNGEKKQVFEGLPGVDPVGASTNIDDKEEARALFGRLGAPAPQGKSFHKLRDGLAYGCTLGFPLIVKPRYGSLSAHTSVNIRDEEALEKAIRIAQQVSRPFIVEQFIVGKLYRATTVGPKLIACGHREPPMITGDGKRTVQELFDARDSERKTLLVSLGYTLEHIPPFPRSHMQVAAETILPHGERVELTWKVNLAFGAGVKDVTDEVHPDNVEMFERIAKAVPELPTLGIDFIAPSIAVSWKDQICGCIELNSLPSIDLHHPPIVEGVNRNVAGALLDYVAERNVY
jgi:D-alanine-D-alanine ligase-like ATP-grasp enzyme